MKYKEPIGRINSTANDRHISKKELDKIDLHASWFTHKGIPADSKRGYRTGSDKNPCETVYINRFNRDVSEVSRSNNSNNTNIFEDTELQKTNEEVKSLRLVKSNNKR